jgi:UPF0716 protein FxsA
MVKWFLIGIVALLAAEVAALTLVAAVIGLPQALGLMAATSIAGLIVLRRPGRARLERLRIAVTQSGIAGLEAGGDAFLTVAAGILLLLPGFITDVLGFLLLFPPVRHWISARFQRFVRTSQQGPAAVVDLDRKDWSQVPERVLDDPRRKNDPL